MTNLLLGVDTGGTFTDFVLFDGGRLRIHKVLSTPQAPEQAILRGIRELGLDSEPRLAGLYLVHGSTVATNAVLEGKGVRCAYITNHGLGDVLSIGRQNRAELYNLQPLPRPVPVEPALCLETGGRLAADGSIVTPLNEADLQQLAEWLAALKPEAVAINLLFSFVDDHFERLIEARVPPGIFISRSSEVLPEYREYERGIATWLNAWVGPLMERYLLRLRDALAPARVSVMQSAGGTVAAAQAGRKAVQLLLSGPAGGLAGAQFVAAAAGRQRLLTFDMGGTSTDVALIDGQITLTSEGRIGPYPVAVPMVDMHTIGAGGGSIAYLDEGGLLQVGPQSAGADPGPACYGRGGKQATVTDANLMLGRLLPANFLGGEMRLDSEAAREVMQTLADPLGLSVEQAALGVVRVANEHMARALRVMSGQRGVDPRELTLLSFGGAGGLHVCALAEALGMTQAMVPVQAGVLSALGMLAAPRARHLSRTVNVPLRQADPAQLDAVFDELVASGRAELLQEAVTAEELVMERSLDLRYRGQTHCLNLPWQGLAECREAFHVMHQQQYGHRLEQAVELVNLRVTLRGGLPPLRLEPLARTSQTPTPEGTRLYGHGQEVPVWDRSQLAAGQQLAGPALITERVSTTYLAPDWYGRVDAAGNLLLTCQAAD